MKKIKFLIISVLIIALIFIARKLYIQRPLTYPGVTPETFAYLLVPADENEGIYQDVKGALIGGSAYLFLPTRADKSDVIFYCMDAQDKPLERYEVDFNTQTCEILGVPVYCMQSKLPTVQISLDPKFGDIEAVRSDIKHETSAYGDMVVSCREDVAQANGWEELFKTQDRSSSAPHSVMIKGRGNNTWEEDKKPYLVKTEENVSLLGMASGKDWVFLANVVDHTLVRNQVILELARRCGCKYVPDLQPVDLFVDGEYLGNYSMCTQVEIGKGRVDIDAGHDYFYRLGLPTGKYKEIESKTLLFDDNYVELINAKNDESDERAFEIIQRVFSEIEDTASSDFLNDIDIESWARCYWVQEFAKNTDACVRSIYLYYDNETEKVYMVAPWDFDRTIGTVEQTSKPDIDFLLPYDWAARKDEWYVPLFEHEEFVNEVGRVYFEGGIKEAFAGTYDESFRALSHISDSAGMNFTRWDYLERPLEGYYNKIAFFMGDSSYESEVAWLTEWIRKRTVWIDEEMNGVSHTEG